jgi:hypothetical protein
MANIFTLTVTDATQETKAIEVARVARALSIASQDVRSNGGAKTVVAIAAGRASGRLLARDVEDVATRLPPESVMPGSLSDGFHVVVEGAAAGQAAPQPAPVSGSAVGIGVTLATSSITCSPAEQEYLNAVGRAWLASAMVAG